MSNLFLGSLFLLGTFFDIKYKALPKWFLISGFLISLILYGILRPVSLEEMLGGMLLGGILIFIGYITKGALGYGDGIFLAIAGVHLGLEKVLGILLSGLLLSAVFSLILLLLRKVSRKTTLPFIPFLTIALISSFLGR